MNDNELSPRARHLLKVLGGAGFEVRDGLRVLDIGCGEGNTVRALRAAGLDAIGCDVSLRTTPGSVELVEKGLIKPIEMQPYRLLFDDDEFDLVISSEVLEHVMNYDDFVRETHRVLKRGGLSMHVFPARWTPVEVHTYVPLGSVFRSYMWLRLWAALGVRNEYQKGSTASEVAKRNLKFLIEQTNYPSNSRVRQFFLRRFSKVHFREDLFLKNATSGRARAVARLTGAMPFLIPVYRATWNRVLLAYK